MPKISQLTTTGTLNGTENVPLQIGSGNGKTTLTNMKDWLESVLQTGASVTVDDQAPTGPTSEGDLWYDSSSGGLYVWVGGTTNAWIQTNGGGQGGGGASVTVSSTAPADPVEGDLWYDDTNAILYVYVAGTTNAWVQAGGGSGGGSGGSTAKSGPQTITLNSEIPFNHGFGDHPDLVEGYLTCTQAEFGYQPGDRLLVSSNYFSDGTPASSQDHGVSFTTTTTQAIALIGEDIEIPSRTTPGTSPSISSDGIGLTNWKLEIVAIKFSGGGSSGGGSGGLTIESKLRRDSTGDSSAILSLWTLISYGAGSGSRSPTFTNDGSGPRQVYFRFGASTSSSTNWSGEFTVKINGQTSQVIRQNSESYSKNETAFTTFWVSPGDEYYIDITSSLLTGGGGNAGMFWEETTFAGGSGGGGTSGGGALGSFSQYVDSSGYVYLTGTSNQTWTTASTIPGYDPNSLYAYTLINSSFGKYINARHGHGRFMNASIAEVQGLRYGVDMPAGGSYGWPVALVSDGEYSDSGDKTSMSFYYPQQGYVGTPMDSASIVDGTSKGTEGTFPGGSMMYRNSSSVGYGLYTRIDPSNGNIQIRSYSSQGSGVVGGFMWFKLNTTTVPCYFFDSTGQKFTVENYTHS